MAAFNNGPSAGSAGAVARRCPISVAQSIEIGAGLMFLGRRPGGVRPAGPAGARGALLAPLTLYLDAGALVRAADRARLAVVLSAPQTRYSSGMIAVMHSAQYLWITGTSLRATPQRVGARRRMERPGVLGHARRRRHRAVPAGALAGQLRLARRLHRQRFHRGVDRQHPSLHDRRRRLETAQPARRPGARAGRCHGCERRGGDAARVARRPRRPMPPRQASRAEVGVAGGARCRRHAPRRPGGNGPMALWAGRWPRGTGAAGGGNETESLRQRAYARLSQAESAAETRRRRRPRCDARRVNPQNPILAQALVRLLIEAEPVRRGIPAESGAAARWPDDVDTLVNAGVLAHRSGDSGAAERWWTRASRSNRLSVGSTAIWPGAWRRAAPSRDALSHYQRYLELVTRAAADDRPSAGVVAVVIKFGDALAHEGEPVSRARSTFGDPHGRPDRTDGARHPGRGAAPRARCAGGERAHFARRAVDQNLPPLIQNLPPSTRKLCAVHAPPSSAARNSTICANSSA